MTEKELTASGELGSQLSSHKTFPEASGRSRPPLSSIEHFELSVFRSVRVTCVLWRPGSLRAGTMSFSSSPSRWPPAAPWAEHLAKMGGRESSSLAQEASPKQDRGGSPYRGTFSQSSVLRQRQGAPVGQRTQAGRVGKSPRPCLGTEAERTT